MEKLERVIRREVKVCHISLLLLVLLRFTTHSSAQNTTETTTTTSEPFHPPYTTSPANLSVAVGASAVFQCGGLMEHAGLTFTYYGRHRNYTLTCPNGHVEDIPQALEGTCEVRRNILLAVWTLKGTSYSDNGTRVICQQKNNPNPQSAWLFVYDNGNSYAVLIGCAIGGFFGILLVFGLAYVTLQRSESFQKCFAGKETEDDTTTIVSKDIS